MKTFWIFIFFGVFCSVNILKCFPYIEPKKKSNQTLARKGERSNKPEYIFNEVDVEVFGSFMKLVVGFYVENKQEKKRRKSERKELWMSQSWKLRRGKQKIFVEKLYCLIIYLCIFES